MDISKKKELYSISSGLRKYLKEFGREKNIPVSYEDLLRYKDGFPLFDKTGKDTLWETVMFDPESQAELNFGLTSIYALLKTDGDLSVMEHLIVDRIDYCQFGNSKPFRVRIVNQFNDNYDYFYVKTADASRVYGLELEHILSPNRINYFVNKNSLIEEHIAGIPGDAFVNYYINLPNFNKVRLAKEFVKFNERCFVRLLGDMRSYNYVIDVTPDFEEEQYRVRALDFDQQSYEGRLRMYMPQYFKENNKIVNFCIEVMNPETVRQYQYEERTLMKRRYEAAKEKIDKLMACIILDEISTPDKTKRIINELNVHHKTTGFNNCKNMGEAVRLHLQKMLTQPKPEKLTGKASFKLK
ncbi:MAG: hypothetical protein P8M05_05820 [Flavobacteriales bacterium]|nr:hypothetical protein [Flavobacteriales bacterium]